MTMTFPFSKKDKSPFKTTTQLPKTAQDTIPFIEAYDNGLFLVDENKYTLIFAFENIDYVLIRDKEQEENETAEQSAVRYKLSGIYDEYGG